MTVGKAAPWAKQKEARRSLELSVLCCCKGALRLALVVAPWGEEGSEAPRRCGHIPGTSDPLPAWAGHSEPGGSGWGGVGGGLHRAGLTFPA
jgi:hypothetical protein